jgi:hypothetical protein
MVAAGVQPVFLRLVETNVAGAAAGLHNGELWLCLGYGEAQSLADSRAGV